MTAIYSEGTTEEGQTVPIGCRTHLIALLIAGGACGCAGLSEYQGEQPPLKQAPSMSRVECDTCRTIPYRPLRRGDFRSERPPKEFVHQTEITGAVTCAIVKTGPDFWVSVRSAVDKEGGYVARLEQLSFRAEMDRECSWWNELMPGLVTDRILQHEQIHFALFEIAARRLNEQVGALMRNWRYRAGSPEEAGDAAHFFLGGIMHEAMMEMGKRNADFDRETRSGQAWERQQGWHRRVERELRETADFAAPRLLREGFGVADE